MEEVRSYWQVASISHFCTIFGKSFKLPSFEPEELEQAFILDIPPPPQPTSSASTNKRTNNINHNSNIITADQSNGHHSEREDSPESPAPSEHPSEDYQPPPSLQGQLQNCEQNSSAQTTNQTDDQQELHLLVKLAIALLKPHFSTKISQLNWEVYLRRIVDSNWVELEHHPSPFRVPLISQDGVELTKNLIFNELPLSDKIDLFYALCDYRFWCEDAADALKDFTPEDLRLESIGKDSQGYEYWYFSGTRLFRENKELTQDIILRKKRIKELEYKLIELEKNRIFYLQEEKRKAELERARQLAAEAREARLAAKKQQEQETNKKRKSALSSLPPRTGLRERRSSTTSNNNELGNGKTPTTRSKQTANKQQVQSNQQQSSTTKNTRRVAKNSKHNDQSNEKDDSPDLPKKSPEQECQEELERLIITVEDRAEAWRLECDSLEDWESFATKFEKTKSTNEKYLAAHINEHILPVIRATYAKRAAEVRRKEKEMLLSLASRRVSTRIITKRAQEEEEERQAQVREAELRRKKVEAETRLRAELEQEMRARKNKPTTNGTSLSSTCSEDGDETNGRYNLRQTQPLQLPPPSPSHEFDGIIHPDNLSEFYEALELVIDTVRTSKHAWPFVDPVPDTVPGYYDLITEPMDLKKLRTKVEFREYRSLVELEKDFQLLVNNCERFNGYKNVYTKMVYKLWKSFRKNVRLYLQRDLSMDESETFVYPPQPKPKPDTQEEEEEELQEEKEEENTMAPRSVTPPEPTSPLPPTMSPTPISESTNMTDIKPPPNSCNHMAIDNHNEVKKNTEVQHELELDDKHVTECLPDPKFKISNPPLPGLNIEKSAGDTMAEDIIIDSYDVPCPDEDMPQYIYSYDALEQSS